MTENNISSSDPARATGSSDDKFTRRYVFIGIGGVALLRAAAILFRPNKHNKDAPRDAARPIKPPAKTPATATASPQSVQ